ncbi:MAG: cytochrome c biogenesis protein CcsA [Betaproteobacteria bacterium]|nr:cytochrome c biogenesis protein CcsA [Betaproteobacteria bacterium]
MSLDWFYPVVGALYALVGWHFWRTRWKALPQGVTVDVRRRWEPFALLLPLTLHFLLLHAVVATPEGLQLGVGNVVSMIGALTVLVYWLASFHMRMEALHAPLAMFAAMAVFAPWLLPSVHLMHNSDEPAFRLHLMIALLAYSLFTIAALHASLMSVVEKRLHRIGTSPDMPRLPPLLTLESVLFRLIGVGFTLLTLTLISGMLFSEELFHEPVQFNHKTVFAALSWGVYAVLLGGRKLWGWRGRVAVRWTWFGFTMLLLAYLGTHFVLEIILHRPGGG